MSHAALKNSILSPSLTLAPGIFDMMSLLVADEKEFPALFFSGYWGMASHLGVPDAGIATYSDFSEQISKMCAVAKTPIIADADTGFGGLLNLDHTVRGYEDAGVAAIQLEDQVSPKRCGHQPGKQVVSTAEMVTRIKVAVDARTSDDFLILARTDALAIEGVDRAIERGQAYQEAGADVVFIETPNNEDEMRRICCEVPGPQMVNMAHGGKTPILPAAQLQEIGYSLAIVPSAPPLAALAAMNQSYDSIKEGHLNCETQQDLYDFHEFCNLIGFPEVRAFEQKWAGKE